MGSLWLSGRASERGIQRSEVRFLMGTQNFFLCPTLVTRRKKHISLFLYRAKNLTSLLFLSISKHITPLKQKKKDQNSPPSRRNTFVHLICVATCDTEHSFEPQLILYLYLITLIEVLHSFSMNSPGAMAKRVRSARRRQVLEDPV